LNGQTVDRIVALDDVAPLLADLVGAPLAKP
jgi:hypothetical protein